LRVRPVVESILVELIGRHKQDGRVHLNDIAEVIGDRALTYDEVEGLVTCLEAEGLEVGEPPDAREIGVMRDVLATARRLRGELGRRPKVDEIAKLSGHPARAVRRALENGSRLGK
jgi:Sigma-70 region 3